MTIIAFISQKGGVGKSTLARLLSVEATKKKLKTLLADCDHQQKTSWEWTQWRKESKITPAITCQVFNSGGQRIQCFNQGRNSKKETNFCSYSVIYSQGSRSYQRLFNRYKL